MENTLQVSKYVIKFQDRYTPSFKKKVSKVVASSQGGDDIDKKIDAQYDIIACFITEIKDTEKDEIKQFPALMDNLTNEEFLEVVKMALEVCKSDPSIYETIALSYDLIEVENAEYIQKKMKQNKMLSGI